MFFRQKSCEKCRSKDERIKELEKKLQSALDKLSFSNGTAETSNNVEVTPNEPETTSMPKAEFNIAYYDKSRNWRLSELSEIEREIKNIYEKFGRTKDSISAVNELQSIQQEILKRKPNLEEKKKRMVDLDVRKSLSLQEGGQKEREKKTRRHSYNKQTVHNAIRAICEQNPKQFKSIILTASTNWSTDSISDTDRAALLKFIEKYASKVAKWSGFKGDPESFGALLSKDERALNRLLESQIPALLKEINKVEQDKQLKNMRWTALQPILRDNLSTHKSRLVSNLRKSYIVNEYGTVEKDLRDVEIERFLKSVKLLSKANRAGLGRVLGYVKSWASREVNNTSINTPLPDNGIDFEYWVADRLKEYDWDVQVTQGSGDQGVDVIAKQNRLRVAVQCKLYQGSVGNKAVQETLAGMSFFDLERGIVISTGKYTRSARELAEKNRILLLSPEDIPYVLDFLLE